MKRSEAATSVSCLQNKAAFVMYETNWYAKSSLSYHPLIIKYTFEKHL